MADSLLDGDNHNDAAEREAIIAKWKDKPQEELLSAKAESDLYIKTLTARLDDLKKDYLEVREQHQAGTQLKELIDRLEKAPKPEPDNSQNTQREESPAAIKPEDIDARIAAGIAGAQRTREQKENFNNIQAKLREQFGDNYQSVYKQRLESLGLTDDFGSELAKNHPAAFVRTFGLDQQQTSQNFAAPRSSARQASFAPSTPVRNWAYYQEMKKTNPRLYLDPKIAVQMHDDAVALGDAFGLPED